MQEVYSYLWLSLWTPERHGWCSLRSASTAFLDSRRSHCSAVPTRRLVDQLRCDKQTSRRRRCIPAASPDAERSWSECPYQTPSTRKTITQWRQQWNPNLNVAGRKSRWFWKKTPTDPKFSIAIILAKISRNWFLRKIKLLIIFPIIKIIKKYHQLRLYVLYEHRLCPAGNRCIHWLLTGGRQCGHTFGLPVAIRILIVRVDCRQRRFLWIAAMQMVQRRWELSRRIRPGKFLPLLLVQIHYAKTIDNKII